MAMCTPEGEKLVTMNIRHNGTLVPGIFSGKTKIDQFGPRTNGDAFLDHRNDCVFTGPNKDTDGNIIQA